jgi:mannan endo-1,4-beta-mannosidase
VVFKKGSPFANPPVATDGEVYTDEFVDFMVKKYGSAAAAQGVKFYDIDNEPGLWPDTHPFLHPAKTGAAELVERTAGAAAAVKSVDPAAEVFGAVFFGYSDYFDLHGAADWAGIRDAAAKAGRPYDWYIDYFLEGMRKASEQAGRRLLDVLDIHWYSEAEGDHRVNDTTATTAVDRKARMESPRSLWDSAYVETSWISKWATPRQPVVDWGNPTPGPVNLLPRIFASIAAYYPGTRLSITEFNYGGNGDVSGGIATADFLGVIGRLGVYAASWWELADGPAYTASAYRLFRNYDGAKSAFGTVATRATASDRDNASVYASYNPGGNEVHLIVLNKSQTGAIKGVFHVTSPVALAQGRAWGFDGSATALKEKTAVGAVTGNAFNYTLPPLTAWHFVIKTASALPAAVRSVTLAPPPLSAAGLHAYLPDGRALAPDGGRRTAIPFWLWR